MTITFDGFTEVETTNYSIDLDDTNVRGLCLLNDIWRVGNGSDIKAFTDTFVADTDNDITLSGLTTGEVIHGLTTDGTNLIVLTKNDADERRLRFITSSGDITATVLLSIPTGYQRAPCIAYDLDNSEIWITWVVSVSGNAPLFKSYSSSGAELTGASASFTGANANYRPTGMVWWNGYLITTNQLDAASTRKFFVYNLFDNSPVTIPDSLLINNSALGKKDNTVYVLEQGGTTPAINDWTINSTDSDAVVPDAPTGLDGTENTNGEVVLTWDDPSDDTITDHAIFRKVGNGTYAELTTTALITGQTYTDDTAVAGTGYTYKIRAINATGNSSDSNEFPFTTAVADTTAPTIDSGVPLNANVTSTAVQWRVTFSEDVQNVDETDFGIKRVGVPNFNPDSVTQISASIYDVFGTLPEPDVYHLRLRGISDITDLSGNSRTGTGEISGSTITYTAPVTDITAPTFEVDGNSIDFATTVAYNGVYTVGVIAAISEVNTTSVITGDDNVDTSVAGDYTVTYTVTDAAGNASEIVETVTVSAEVITDTTTPTFTITASGNDYTADFATTVAFNGVYTVGAISGISETSDGGVVTGASAVDTSVAGEYTVTYTVTDTAGNAGIIVETVTVSAEVITTGDELLTYTDNAEVPIPELGQSHYTERTITIPDEYDGTISNLILDLDITHPAEWDIRVELESPEGTNIRVFSYDLQDAAWDEEPFELDDWNGEMTAGVWTLKINDGFTNEDSGTLHSWELRISTEEGLDNGTSTPVETVPDSPSSVTAIEVSGNVVLEWADASDDSITGYKIFRKTGTGAFTTLVTDTASTTLTYTDTTVSVDTSYTYKIQAINDVGNSGDSHEVTITTDPAPDVTAPTFTVEANGDDNTSNFTTTVAFNGTYTVGTIADISETGTTSAISGNTDVDTGTAGEYMVTYTVTDTAGNSTEIVETITVSVEIITATVPAAPTGLAATQTHEEVTLTWTDPSDDTITGYKIYRDGVELVADTASTTLEYVDDTVESGTEYVYKIAAINDTGTSDDSSEVTITTDEEPVVVEDGELTGFTRNATEDITSLHDDNDKLNGWCWWDGYWRSIDQDDQIIYALEADGTTVPGKNIDLSVDYTGTGYGGLTTDGTNLVVLHAKSTGRFILKITPTGVISTVLADLAEPSQDNLQGTPGAIAYDVDNDQYWITWHADTNFGAWLQPYDSSFAEITGGFRAPSTTRRITGMSWENGYLICVGLDETRFRVFDLDDNSEVAVTTDALHADGRGLGVKDGIAFVAYRDNAVDAWTINYAEAADTTAPTFTIESNGSDYTADFATTIVFEESYTVGVISDISETGTTSVISGDDDVDTSVAGEYTVTYTVTDTAGNVGEIVETITVSAEIITATVPDAPEGLGGTQTYEEVTLTWDDPSNDTITGYKIYRDGVVLVEDTGSTTREYVDDTVAGNTEYVYKIAAINDEGTSDDSSTYTITTDPLFTVNGGTVDFDTEIDEGDTYRSGITVYNVSGIIDGDIVVKDSSGTVIASINNTEPDAGSYTIEYSIMNVPNNPTVTIIESLTVTAAPIVPDTTAPTFTVKDNSADFDITIELGDVYNVGTFEDIVDEDASPEEDIVYKNSAGTTITSFDGDELAVGTYSVEYTLTDDANNATTIIESITVEDTTAPTFEVDDNTVDYTTELTDAETYEVGTIDNITDDGITTTSNPVYKDSTGAVISSFDNTMLSAGDYSVEYTVTDDSNNAYTIIESITVTETETTGVILTGLTRNSGIDFNTTSIYHQGFCKWNGYWRSLDWPANVIKATSVVDGSDAPSENISIPNDGVERGLTTDGTNLIVLVGHSGNSPKIRIITSDKTISDIITFNVLTGTGTSGLDTPKCIMWDIANSLLWIGWGGTSDTVGYYSAHTKEGVLQESLGFPANSANHDPSGGVWWNGYLITVDGVNDRFFIYKTSTKAYLSSINPSGVASNTQGLGISGNQIYLGQDGATLIRGWNITFTGEVDTTDPTFQVNGNSAAFITFVAQNGVYAVGVISDISEVNTTSTINGNSNVNTSMTGDYLVTYRVTDSSGNYTEIVETVRVIESLDMTAPTFLVDENNTDFTTNIRSDETYVVKAITDIASPNDQLTEEIIYKDGDGNVINSFNQSRLNEELYFVEYTVRDESNNIGSITETIVVEIITTIAVEDVSLDELPATSAFDFKVKWKNHYEVLQQIALNSGNDLWFEGSRIFIGTKGKLVNLQREDKLYKSLISKINLDTYANIVNVIGAKSEGENLHGTLEGDFEKTRYKYEKVISNNNLDTQEKIDTILPKLVKEFASIAPDVDIGISAEVIDKYDLRSGDIIKLNSNTETQNILGYYRIISLVTGTKGSGLKLQFSRTGKFIPRIADSIDIFEALLLKMKELEINS